MTSFVDGALYLSPSKFNISKGLVHIGTAFQPHLPSRRLLPSVADVTEAVLKMLISSVGLSADCRPYFQQGYFLSFVE
jgi:hypothetical protein